MLATLVSAIAFGVIPALRIAKQADAGSLREGSARWIEPQNRAAARHARHRLGRRVGCSAGRVRAAARDAAGGRHRHGLRGRRRADAHAALPVPKYDTVARRHEFYSRVLEGVRALPGVTAAGYTTGLPLVERARIWGVTVRDAPPRRLLAPAKRDRRACAL